MQIQTVVGGKTGSPEKIYTLTEVSELSGIKTSDLRTLYKKNNITTYNVGNAVCISETDYKKLFKPPEKEKTEETEVIETPAKTKRDYKHEAKAKLKRKFKVGDLISLKIKPKGGSREIVKGYRVVKFIYTINDFETNILIVKQIYGPKTNIHTLNQHDCKKLHIKYEPELQVFSMFMNWGIFKPKKTIQNA